MITLTNMHEHTAQEVFDVCALHLLTQNKRSGDTHGTGNCMYRNPFGLKCAIGILIPDELYHASMEGNGINTLAAEYGITDHVDILRDLQSLHDIECDVSQWKKRLTRMARSYSLSDKLVVNFKQVK